MTLDLMSLIPNYKFDQINFILGIIIGIIVISMLIYIKNTLFKKKKHNLQLLKTKFVELYNASVTINKNSDELKNIIEELEHA